MLAGINKITHNELYWTGYSAVFNIVYSVQCSGIHYKKTSKLNEYCCLFGGFITFSSFLLLLLFPSIFHSRRYMWCIQIVQTKIFIYLWLFNNISIFFNILSMFCCLGLFVFENICLRLRIESWEKEFFWPVLFFFSRLFENNNLNAVTIYRYNYYDYCYQII